MGGGADLMKSPPFLYYWETEVTDENLTRSLGEAIGRILTPGDIVTLTGNLGSGKTVFTQGVAKGAGVSENAYVTSPTYTLVNHYPGRIDFYHMDLYRIPPPVDLADLGFDDVLCSHGVCVVEWPDRLPSGYLLEAKTHLAVHIIVTGLNSRRIECRFSGVDLWERIQPIIRSWRKEET